MSRTPDYILKALNKATGTKTGKIGCAWQNPDGSLSLALDIAIMPDPNQVLTLFPNDRPVKVPATTCAEIAAALHRAAPLAKAVKVQTVLAPGWASLLTPPEPPK